MALVSTGVSTFIDAFIASTATSTVPMHWYAIADAAQNQALPKVLTTSTGMSHRCLFNTPEGNLVAALSPHLVALPVPSANAEHPAWKWIERNARKSPCVTVLASVLDFETLHAHLQHWIEVLLPDGEDMFFAFWDPAILAVLVGQDTDTTLNVPGPVFSAAQCSALLQGIQSWWYWDRDGGLQRVHGATQAARATPATTTKSIELPLKLTQLQVDMLVEASVPDHVLSHLQENQPQLFQDLAHHKRYGYVQRMLTGAQKLGLSAMKDLVNFVSLGLIYRQRLGQDAQILQLLQQVQNQTLTLDEAMTLMPE